MPPRAPGRVLLDLESELQGDGEEIGFRSKRLRSPTRREIARRPDPDEAHGDGGPAADKASTKEFAWMESDDDKSDAEEAAAEDKALGSRTKAPLSCSYRVVFKAVNIRSSPTTTAEIAGRKLKGDVIRVSEEVGQVANGGVPLQGEVLTNDHGDWVRLSDHSGWMLVKKSDGKELLEKVHQDRRDARDSPVRHNDKRRRTSVQDKGKERKGLSASTRGGRVERRNGSRSPSAARSVSPEGPPLPATLAEIQTFSQMVRMADSLKARVRSMTASELAECLSAAARVKFYDGDMFDAVMPRIQRQLLVSRGVGNEVPRSPFTTEELITIMASLADLNIFNKEVFDRIVKEMAANRFRDLQGPQRGRILSAFSRTKYECAVDQEFHDWLKEAEKSERYEEACVKQRMIRGNSSSGTGMHAPEGYLRSFICGNSDGVEVRRPQGLNS